MLADFPGPEGAKLPVKRSNTDWTLLIDCGRDCFDLAKSQNKPFMYQNYDK